MGVGIFLTGASLPYTAPVLAGGIRAVLAYPKLYGALLLWAVAVYYLSEQQRAGEVRIVEGFQGA